MRFVIAIVLFVCALLSVGYGLAQRTVLAGPDRITATGEVDAPQQITLLRGETLGANPSIQNVTITGEGPMYAAYGRTVDVLGWIGETGYDEFVYDAETSELEVETTEGSDPDAIPSAVDSDLWLGEQIGEDELTLRIRAPQDVSVLVVSGAAALPAGAAPAAEEPAAEAPAEGEAAEPDAADEAQAGSPAASAVAIAWPVDNSTPWSGPLIIGGIVALLLGLLAFIWALLHARKRRGPRRTTPRLPKPPKPPRLTARSQRKQQALPSGPSERSRRLGTRKMIVPVLALVPAVALAGCTSGGPISDLLGATPTPSPTATDGPAEPETDAIAVTERQFDGIVADVRTAVAEADAAGDAELAATRLAGPALQLRDANYRMRANDGAIALQPPIPTGAVSVLLPQQNDGWPRTVFAVLAAEEETTAPQALMLEQETARDPYKATYVISLEPSAKLPALAGAEVGAARLRGDFEALKLTPDELVAAYGDILTNDAESASAPLFQAEGDTLRQQLGKAFKDDRAANLAESAQIAFSSAAGTGPTIAFGTNDAGVLVAVSEHEIETVTPSETGAAINPSGTVKALLGADSTTKGVIATYGLQLLFYVPPVTAEDEPIRLLGFSQGLIDAKEPE